MTPLTPAFTLAGCAPLSIVHGFEGAPWMRSRLEVAWWCADERLSSSAVSVLRFLTSYADLEGRCQPSVKLIAEITGLNRKTIFRAQRELEAADRISMEKRHRQSTIYVLTP